MDLWAKRYFGKATFVCVGCAGPDLAEEFARRLQLSKCVLTYVDERNGPKWGQLGCSGFIVIDAQGKVASRATKPFMQVRERAFADVERLVDSLIGSEPPPPLLPPGLHVEINGLKKAELNGTRGTVVEMPAGSDRCTVETERGIFRVKAENLRVLDQPDDGCAGGS